MRGRPAAGVLAAAVLLGGPVALAFASGAYFDGPRLTALLATAVLLAVLAAAGVGPLPRGTPGRAAVLGVWLLAGWVLLSRGRSPVPDVAGDDAERVLLYAGFLVAGAVTWRSRAAARRAEPAVAAGALVVLLYGLAGRWLPGIIELTRTESAGGRLEQPLTYWNATGLLAAMGAVLCIRIGGDRGRAVALRAGFAAGTVPLLSGVYLSFSRGAAAATVAGLLVLVLCAPERHQLRAVAVGIATGAVGIVASGLLPGVRGLEGTLTARESDGLLALAVTLAAMAAAALLTVRAARGEAAGRLRTDAIALPRFVRPTVAVVVVLAVVVPVLASRDERAGHRPQAGFGASTGRFTNVNSNRYDYWRVAVRTFADHPLIGVGSGGWAIAWLRERPIADPARDAHSIELETLAELGLVGFAVLMLVLGGVARCAALVRRADPQLAAGPCAALTAWAAHSALDWDWEMPGVTLPALTLAGILIARADATRLGDARQNGDRSRLARAVLLGAAVLCAVLGLTARHADHRCAGALAGARALGADRAPAQRVAHEVVDDCADPQMALTGIAGVFAVDRPAAVTAVRALSRRDPDRYFVWLARARLEPDPALARVARARVRALNPRYGAP